MRNYHQLLAIIAGTALMSATVLTLPTVAQAIPDKEVSDAARIVTVLIGNNQGYGFGVMRDGGSSGYYTLTTKGAGKFKLVVDNASGGIKGSATFKTARNLIAIHGMGNKDFCRAEEANLSEKNTKAESGANCPTPIAIFLKDAVSIENPETATN